MMENRFNGFRNAGFELEIMGNTEPLKRLNNVA